MKCQIVSVVIRQCTSSPSPSLNTWGGSQVVSLALTVETYKDVSVSEQGFFYMTEEELALEIVLSLAVPNILVRRPSWRMFPGGVLDRDRGGGGRPL